uniref:V-set and immunoglobulin domain containing 8 n=1 Tax=Chrysemys picta bellii TaxID=8478 RepID=A0A8C3HCX2_CHRPI
MAQGDSVRLGCPYILEPEDNGPTNLDIVWTMVNPDQRLYGSAPGLQQRVSFVAQDPSLYDASIHLANLQMSDSATYECTVKKATVDTHQVTVTKPAPPRCWMDGEPVRGGDLMLRCCSDGGSLPLSYQWSKMGGDYQPGSSGDLMIQSLSQEHSGTYACRVTNRVGYSQCMVRVSIPPGGGGWVLKGQGGVTSRCLSLPTETVPLLAHAEVVTCTPTTAARSTSATRRATSSAPRGGEESTPCKQRDSQLRSSSKQPRKQEPPRCVPSPTAPSTLCADPGSSNAAPAHGKPMNNPSRFGGIPKMAPTQGRALGLSSQGSSNIQGPSADLCASFTGLLSPFPISACGEWENPSPVA